MTAFPTHGDNFKVVAGPITVREAMTFEREPLPEAIIQQIHRSAAGGVAPGKIASGCSTIQQSVTKNAVLRVLAGGRG